MFVDKYFSDSANSNNRRMAGEPAQWQQGLTKLLPRPATFQGRYILRIIFSSFAFR
jgi:hypothetical protein